jgi:Tol biopolymer transport system component
MCTFSSGRAMNKLAILGMALVVVAGGAWSLARAAGSMMADAPMPTSLEGMLVFVRALDGMNELMAMWPDGRGLVSLRVQGSRPHVSQDGRRVAYETPDGGVAALDLASGRVTPLHAPRASSPRWSPDGRRVLFSSDRSGRDELYTINSDGSRIAVLSDGRGGYGEADWSPDGRIVFRRAVGDGGDIWTMNADGTGAAPLHEGERADSDPRWSPDGAKIAFVRVIARASGEGFTSEIFVIGADGAGLTRLTYHDGEDWAPSWTPDGSGIAFFGYRAGPNDPDLFLVRPDGRDLQLLQGGPTYDHGPAFGPAPRPRLEAARRQP